MAELLIGCGSNRTKKLYLADSSPEWTELVTLDMNATHNPDVVWDLNLYPFPFHENQFDEIHAYDVLEHIGQQGDWRSFFDLWSEFWRILKPDGIVAGISPHHTSPWAWGDPSHTRIVTSESFIFLSQPEYDQVGTTPMSDFRPYYKADFDAIFTKVTDDKQLLYVLKAVKPSRIKI